MIRNVQRWLPAYIKDRMAKRFTSSATGQTHILLAICDHYEPLWNKADYATGLKRVTEWCKRYPAIADKFMDSDGHKPKYTFFYPVEEYKPEYMKLLSDLCHKGYSEVEVHLHHDNDTSDNLRKTLLDFKDLLADNYNLLSKDKDTGEVKYGFIHGNWALNNSRPDGRLCGVDNELEVLRDTGCYADFTMPSAPDITQTSRINSIYHDDGLLMVQGPLLLNWQNRKWGILPKIENSAIGHNDRISADRIQLWLDADIHVKDHPEYVFVKLYTHGCQDQNLEYLLSGGLDELFVGFGEIAHSPQSTVHRKECKLHFVTAREMVNVVLALSDRVSGLAGSRVGELSDEMRDYRYVAMIHSQEPSAMDNVYSSSEQASIASSNTLRARPKAESSR